MGRWRKTGRYDPKKNHHHDNHDVTITTQQPNDNNDPSSFLNDDPNNNNNTVNKDVNVNLPKTTKATTTSMSNSFGMSDSSSSGINNNNKKNSRYSYSNKNGGSSSSYNINNNSSSSVQDHNNNNNNVISTTTITTQKMNHDSKNQKYHYKKKKSNSNYLKYDQNQPMVRDLNHRDYIDLYHYILLYKQLAIKHYESYMDMDMDRINDDMEEVDSNSNNNNNNNSNSNMNQNNKSIISSFLSTYFLKAIIPPPTTTTNDIHNHDLFLLSNQNDNDDKDTNTNTIYWIGDHSFQSLYECHDNNVNSIPSSSSSSSSLSSLAKQHVPYLRLPSTLRSKERKMIHTFCMEHDLFHETIPIISNHNHHKHDNNQNMDHNHKTNTDNVVVGSCTGSYLVVSIYSDGFVSLLLESQQQQQLETTISHPKIRLYQYQPFVCKRKYQEQHKQQKQIHQLENKNTTKREINITNNTNTNTTNNGIITTNQKNISYRFSSSNGSSSSSSSSVSSSTTKDLDDTTKNTENDNALTLQQYEQKFRNEIYKFIDQPSTCIRFDCDSDGTGTGDDSNFNHHHIDSIDYEYLYNITLDILQPPQLTTTVPVADSTTTSGRTGNRDKGHQNDQWMFIDTAEKMIQCVQEIMDCQISELAFDLECYNVSKYTQLTCLLQITTASYIVPTSLESSTTTKATMETNHLIHHRRYNKEYVIDPLAPGVWYEIYRLNIFFGNPNIIKIGHSVGGLDIKCLYRDFGIIIINLFDTYEAAKILQLPNGHGLVHLCEYYYHHSLQNHHNNHNHSVQNQHPSQHFELYKSLKDTYQRCDWTKRPLTSEMIQYGRYDIHYLLLLRHFMIRDLTAKELYNIIPNHLIPQSVLRTTTTTTISASSTTTSTTDSMMGNHNIKNSKNEQICNAGSSFDTSVQNNNNDTTTIAVGEGVSPYDWLNQAEDAYDNNDDDTVYNMQPQPQPTTDHFTKEGNNVPISSFEINHAGKRGEGTVLYNSSSENIHNDAATMQLLVNEDILAENDNSCYETPEKTPRSEDGTTRMSSFYSASSHIQDEYFMTPSSSFQSDHNDTTTTTDSEIKNGTNPKKLYQERTNSDELWTPQTPTETQSGFMDDQGGGGGGVDSVHGYPPSTVKKSNCTAVVMGTTVPMIPNKNNLNNKNIATASELRLQPRLMSVLSLSQERCAQLWSSHQTEPYLQNATFLSQLKKARLQQSNMTITTTTNTSDNNNKNTTNNQQSIGLLWTNQSTELYYKLVQWRMEVAYELQCLEGFIVSLDFLVLVALKRPMNETHLRNIQYKLPEILEDSEPYRIELINIVIDQTLTDSTDHCIVTTRTSYLYSKLLEAIKEKKEEQELQQQQIHDKNKHSIHWNVIIPVPWKVTLVTLSGVGVGIVILFLRRKRR